MEHKITIPRIPFYFVRHGETDWNKIHDTLCSQDDIPLNETGILQAAHLCKKLENFTISNIYSSPLARARQTAEIINHQFNLQLTYHEGLKQISDDRIARAFEEMLNPSHASLFVSHGEVYRILLRILNIEVGDSKVKNCGLYFFKPSDKSDEWTVSEK